jgi:hypothetical protein
MKHYQGVFLPACFAAMLLAAPLIALSQQTPQPKAVPVPVQKAAPAQKPAVPEKSAATANPAPCCAAGAQKPPAPQVAARKGPPRGPIEKYDCKIGTEDQHARIAVLAQGGEVQSVAYYSKWKPRTCSVHLQRGDAYSRWKDVGDATTVTTEFGDFLIQVSRSEYQLFFREVDRMHYCGMMGKLNGSMTVTRGPKRTCSIEGIMDKNESEPQDDKPPLIPTMTPPGPPLPPEALIPKPAEGK